MVNMSNPPLDALNQPMDAEQLLRRLGARRTLTGFRYTVYMAEQVAENPDRLLLITKRLYRETAKHFGTSPGAVERAVRTVIRDCWKQEDHTLLDTLTGYRRSVCPSNSEWIDLLAEYLRHPMA